MILTYYFIDFLQLLQEMYIILSIFRVRKLRLRQVMKLVQGVWQNWDLNLDPLDSETCAFNHQTKIAIFFFILASVREVRLAALWVPNNT